MSEGIKTIWIKFSLGLLGGNGSRSRGRAWVAVKVCNDFSEHKASCEGWPGMSQVLQTSLLTTCQLTQQERKCEGFIIIIIIIIVHSCFSSLLFPLLYGTDFGVLLVTQKRYWVDTKCV